MRQNLCQSFLVVVVTAVSLDGVPAVAAAKAGETALITAVKTLDADAVSELLGQATDVNQKAPDGATALHWAVHRNTARLVDMLIAAGANVTATNR